MDITKEVQGVGIYAEFARSGATTQIIITPDGYDNEGSQVRMNVIRRTVTTTNPRKQWRFSALPEANEDLISSVATAVPSDEAKEAYCDDRMRYASALFDQIMRGDWVLINDPILVEVSKTDLDVVRQSKTPTKLIYRINQSRTAKGYPTDLVNDEVAVPVSTATVSSTL